MRERQREDGGGEEKIDGRERKGENEKDKDRER